MNPLTQTLELVQKAKGGDRDALNRLFERYYERVRRCVRVRIGPKLRMRLESGDVLQQAFAKAFQIFDRFEIQDEGSFLHWLAEIATRQARDAADRENSKKRTPVAAQFSLDEGFGDTSGAQFEVPGTVTGPDGRAVRHEQEAAVDDCLELLPEHYRTVIVLRDYDGLEWNDVAEKMEKNTDSAARELHRRAQLELAKLLRRRGIGPDSRCAVRGRTPDRRGTNMSHSAQPDVDALVLEYLRGAEVGEPPDLDALAAKLGDESERAELRSLVETAEWARGTFPVPFRPRAVIAGRYVLLEELGSGGFGKVWKAKDQRLGRPVALKLFHPLIDAAELESTLRRERDSLARVSHDGIVRLLDSGRHEDTHYLAMEFVPGKTLDKVLAALAARGPGAPMPDRAGVSTAIGAAPAAGESSLLEEDWNRTCARITVGVLWALAAAHGQQIHHRDLKPGNVLLRPGGRPVLLDFGLAGLGDLAKGTLTDRLFGTAAYLAPEQLDHQRTGKDARTDLYQCGLLLFEMLTFRRAFVETNRTGLLEAVRRGQVDSPSAVRKDVPAPLADICMRALERNPDRRYATADAFRDDLERWLAGQLPAASRLGAAGRAWRRARRFAIGHRTAIAATLLLLAGASAGAWLGLRPEAIIPLDLGNGRWALDLRDGGTVSAWAHELDGQGHTTGRLMPVLIDAGNGARPGSMATLPPGRSTVAIAARSLDQLPATGATIRWHLAEDDLESDWQALISALATRFSDGFVSRAELMGVYEEARVAGKGAKPIRELPIDDLWSAK
jgi:RNA polymerase sigma-70 factor (subfamily 1)